MTISWMWMPPSNGWSVTACGRKISAPSMWASDPTTSFDLAYAYVLARNNHVLEHFSVEMLEGMADHVRRAIQETVGNLVLYAPVADQEQFVSAIAYLIRRLDENTGGENFLRHACHLEPASRTWNYLKDRFIRSLGHEAREGSFRTQDRNAEDFRDVAHPFPGGRFRNEPDTDWSLAPNRAWARSIREKWMKSPGDAPLQVPLVFSGREVFSGRGTQTVVDFSRVEEKAGAHPVVALWTRATEQDLKSAVASAKADPGGWRNLSAENRRKVLKKVAVEIRRARGDLIGAAAAEGGKVFYESDPEVSEAVDFVEYYSRTACDLEALKGVTFHGRGVGLVLSPWNFPIAIPCGGIAASLAAGNTVLMKPASSAVLTAWILCGCFWRAGIDQHTLQFVPCPGETSGHILTTHPDVDYVIFTGGTETGLKIQKARPDGLLAGETGGKNATIVTSMSDRDQAVKNVVHSAFGHSGQKCSATSLLILERSVYEDRNFMRQLVDAAESFSVGSPWEFQHRTGPLIRPPSGDLKWALTELDAGESWALKPKMKENNPRLWSPGIKWGVRPRSRSHMTEFFGPVLSVLRAEDLDEAIDLVNATGYGLTSALESLDQREQDHWQKRVRAGNLYINRGTTGAMVLRQPFGGMGKSALGAGIKAGGPNYLLQFMNFDEVGFPETGALISESPLLTIVQEWETKLFWGRLNVWRKDLEKVVLGIRSCLYWMETEFSRENDYFNLRGQDNIFRYRPYDRVILRLHEKDTLFEVLMRVAAARIAGCKTFLSVQAGICSGAVEFLDTSEGMRFLEDLVPQEQTEDELIGVLAENPLVRYAAPDRVPVTIHEAAAGRGCHISHVPVMMEGRIEMRHYFQELSLCNSYHRYGNLGDRTFLKS